jgi:hypothetical protein
MANCTCPPTVEDQEYEIYKTLNTVAENAEFFSSACWKNLSDDQKLCLVTRSFIDVVDTIGGRGPRGPQGPEGPIGDAGPQGPAGLQGLQGIRGIQGIEGVEGPEVDFRGVVANEAALPNPSTSGYCYFVQDESAYYVYDGSDWIGYGPLQGQPGSLGPVGLSGPAGAAGPQGPQGATGAAGPIGPTGIAGISGGFDASNIILAKVGDNLATKYNQAVALATSIGATATNRVALVIMPGNYSAGAVWNINTEFVDVIGLGSSPKNPKVIISVSAATGISVSANNVRIIGLRVTAGSFPIDITPNRPLQYFQNCTTGTSFIGDVGFGRANLPGQIFNGTFVNCYAVNGFGYSTNGQNANAAGTYINCSVGNGFGYSENAGSGERSAISSGTFIKCNATIGFAGSNGGGSTASGTFLDCTATTFARNQFTGIAKNCIAGANSFGPTSNTGQIIKCKKTSGAFPTPTGIGIIRFSLDGSNNIVNLG